MVIETRTLDAVQVNETEITCITNYKAIPGDENVDMKELKKVRKYRDPKIKVQKLYSFRVNFISVVISALGTISKKLDKKGTWKLLEMKPSVLFFGYKKCLSA